MQWRVRLSLFIINILVESPEQYTDYLDIFFFVMFPRTTRSTLTYTLFHYTTLFRSAESVGGAGGGDDVLRLHRKLRDLKSSLRVIGDRAGFGNCKRRCHRATCPAFDVVSGLLHRQRVILASSTRTMIPVRSQLPTFTTPQSEEHR